MGISTKNVFFNLTKEDKIRRIQTIGCDYFIDDLPEILNMINGKTKKILYDPKNLYKNKNYIKLDRWENLKNLMQENK